MKYLIFLFAASCAPLTVGVDVTTRTGKCSTYGVAYIGKNTMVIEYFCGSEGNVSVKVERLDK